MGMNKYIKVITDGLQHNAMSTLDVTRPCLFCWAFAGRSVRLNPGRFNTSFFLRFFLWFLSENCQTEPEGSLVQSLLRGLRFRHVKATLVPFVPPRPNRSHIWIHRVPELSLKR